MQNKINLKKEVVIKGDKRYTNYILVIDINGVNHNVAIEPKTFGRQWTHPSVRQSFTLLDLVSKLEIKDDEKSK